VLLIFKASDRFVTDIFGSSSIALTMDVRISPNLPYRAALVKFYPAFANVNKKGRHKVLPFLSVLKP
jgi:hypothetical protein